MKQVSDFSKIKLYLWCLIWSHMNILWPRFGVYLTSGLSLSIILVIFDDLDYVESQMTITITVLCNHSYLILSRC